MPATHFICPDGLEWPIADCLKHCRMPQRCMFVPTLRAIAEQRELDGFSVTELISGTREAYLKRTCSYAFKPSKHMYSVHGTAMHTVNEEHSDGFNSEQRIFGKYCSGQPDIYGELISPGIQTLGDYKVTSSFKIMKALGIGSRDVPTGETFKTGPRAGQPKTKKQLFTDGPKQVLEWAMQVNMYRILLESEGKQVDELCIQAICRDFGLQVAKQRGIETEVVLIPINKISDHWLQKYFRAKAKELHFALAFDELPPPCRARENWHGRKCDGYCDVSKFCDYTAAQGGIAQIQKLAEEDLFNGYNVTDTTDPA